MRGRPLPGARSMDPVDRNRFSKVVNTMLAPFLVWKNSLINRFTPYFFDSQTSVSYTHLTLPTILRV